MLLMCASRMRLYWCVSRAFQLRIATAAFEIRFLFRGVIVFSHDALTWIDCKQLWMLLLCLLPGKNESLMSALCAFRFQIATATLEIRFRLEASLLGLQATLMHRNNSGARPRRPNETIFRCNCNFVCQSRSVIAIESRSVTAKFDLWSQMKVGLCPQKSICDRNWKLICDRNESRSVTA